MLPALAALLAAAVAATGAAAPSEPSPAAASPAPEQLASGEQASADGDVVARDVVVRGLPGDGALSGALGGLAPAPTTIVRETRYYGTVTIDHRGHVGRRSPCRSCHGPGPVSKITFTPRIAHERCLGCHQEQAKGPASCKGCHVRPPPPAQVALAARPADEAPVAARPAGPDPANVASALEALERPRPTVFREAFVRHLEVGLAGGHGVGLSVRISSHQDFLSFTQSVDQLRARHVARNIVLLGAGALGTVGARKAATLELSAVAGFDVFERPVVTVFPALGLRGAVEWRPPMQYLQHVTLSLTGIADGSRQTFGVDIGRIEGYLTLATGFRLP